MHQIEINFEAGLREQFPNFAECLRASVYSCGKPFKNIAADLDLSSSVLGRKLSEADDMHFPAYLLPELMTATEDFRPIYWLIEAFCQDAGAQREQAIDSLVKMMPELAKTLKLIASK